MAEATDRLATAMTQSNSTVVSLGAAAVQEGHFLVGRLLAPKAKLPGFKGTIATIWHIRSGLNIQDAGERFVFQFESAAVHNRIMHGGPWFYRNTMLLLGKYDGLGPVESVSLHLMEAWVAVKGLPIALRNKVALSMVGSALGQVVRLDLTALKRKEEEQRVKIVFDVRRRIRTWMIFEFSYVVKLELVLIYEKVKGFCHACGLFLHDALGCDNKLVQEKEEIKAAPPAAAMAGLSLRSEAQAVLYPSGVLTREVRMGRAIKHGGTGLAVLGQESDSQSGGGILAEKGSLKQAGSSFHYGSGPTLLDKVGSVSLTRLTDLVETGKSNSRVEFLAIQTAPVGKKRKAVHALERFGKKYLAFPDSKLQVEENVPLVLQHKIGKLMVSPKKKKIGRLKGSKNKTQGAIEQEGKKLRKYKRKGKLNFDSEEAVIAGKGLHVQPVEGEVVPMVKSAMIESAVEGYVEGVLSPSTDSLI